MQRYCQKCVSCSLRKRTTQKKTAPMQLFPDLDNIFSSISIDILGPLPISSSGFKYILTVCCLASRYIEAIPLADTSSESIAKGLVKEIFCRHGCPRYLLSDNAKNLTGSLMKNICQLLKIRHVTTTVYHPAGNGKVERSHATLAAIISHFVSTSGSEWEEYLPMALFCMRSSVNRATGESPHFLVYGRDPRFPFETLVEPHKINYAVGDNYKEELLLRMKQAFAVARENSRKAAKTSAIQYNKRGDNETRYCRYNQEAPTTVCAHWRKVRGGSIILCCIKNAENKRRNSISSRSGSIVTATIRSRNCYRKQQNLSNRIDTFIIGSPYGKEMGNS